jgi:predicted HNH restriction endonuclease
MLPIIPIDQHGHHTVPLADSGESYVVEPIRDLRPVCPNCHAIIHTRVPPFSIEEMRGILKAVDRRTGRKPSSDGR